MQSLNRLPKALWLLMPTGKWPWADATVHNYRYSFGWDDNGQIWNSKLTYSFRVDDILYGGHAQWNDSTEPASFLQNDVIQVRFNPLNPDISYFPEKDSLRRKRVLLLLALGMLIYIFFLMLIAHYRHRA